MSKTNTPTNDAHKRLWECKECHSMIAANETVAYHLVDRILYGWCEPCFVNRNELKTQAA
ncbi:MAG: hypothetical protein HY231_10775 [Acidobacteria bacterium]|nr:hypothetical protein [Acidobacteriota bacterium]